MLILYPGPLWVVDVAGAKPTPMTDPNDPGWSFEGDRSPDGRQIVFDYFLPTSLQPELRVIDADGTHSSTLWLGGAETPDWGPEGTQLCDHQLHAETETRGKVSGDRSSPRHTPKRVRERKRLPNGSILAGRHDSSVVMG